MGTAIPQDLALAKYGGDVSRTPLQRQDQTLFLTDGKTTAEQLIKVA